MVPCGATYAAVEGTKEVCHCVLSLRRYFRAEIAMVKTNVVVVLQHPSTRRWDRELFSQ